MALVSWAHGNRCCPNSNLNTTSNPPSPLVIAKGYGARSNYSQGLHWSTPTTLKHTNNKMSCDCVQRYVCLHQNARIKFQDVWLYVSRYLYNFPLRISPCQWNTDVWQIQTGVACNGPQLCRPMQCNKCSESYWSGTITIWWVWWNNNIIQICTCSSFLPFSPVDSETVFKKTE